MKIATSEISFLAGEKFEVGYLFRCENNPLWVRTDILIRTVKDKAIIHVGCCDHIPLIEYRLKTRQWLHGLLEENCPHVLGIDINSDAVEYVNGHHFAKNDVYCKNIVGEDFLAWDMQMSNFDYVLLGEILEHVDNPVEFLCKMKSNLEAKGFQGGYIITVPNALSFARSWRLRWKKTELVNSDHRYWFTPFTICKVMYRAGLIPREMLFGSDKEGGNGLNLMTEFLYRIKERIFKKPSKHNSYLGDTIIVIGESERYRGKVSNETNICL